MRLNLALFATLAATTAYSQVNLSSGLSYTQNFDSLASFGTANPWTDNVTLTGWYASKTPGTVLTSHTAYTGATGSDSAGALFSYGIGGTTERALGSLVSNSTGGQAFGLRIANDTLFTMDSVTVSYTGEQWRNGGNTAAQSLFFSYLVSSTPFSSPLPTAQAALDWVSVTDLNFTSPQVGTTVAALNGNAESNQSFVGPVTINGLSLAPGQEIILRWVDLNDSGNDHGLAVDGLTVAFAVPEPSAFALMGLGLAALALRRRK